MRFSGKFLLLIFPFLLGLSFSALAEPSEDQNLHDLGELVQQGKQNEASLAELIERLSYQVARIEHTRIQYAERWFCVLSDKKANKNSMTKPEYVASGVTAAVARVNVIEQCQKDPKVKDFDRDCRASLVECHFSQAR
ncbi:MAG: hypothetical protein J6Y94_08505 [Bacteriovoracaceae bacterium]|nr:hypothetical protein [Bacteriovoracaceae bacterium]